jgi:CO/xanthine dehydrogenase Mo-binding subunit
MLVEGQVQGGVAMGIGMALSEDLIFENGRQVNPSLANYMVPTAVDVPPIEVIIVKNYDPSGPFGAKGVGEPTLVATAPAILNAIYDAVGIRLYSLPATPEKVLQALREKEAFSCPA